jgi:hypothetical protein
VGSDLPEDDDPASRVPVPRDERTGLLIIRAWTEDDSSQPLRAHVRLSTNIAAGVERTVTLTCPDDVGATVAQWLAEVMRS